MIEHYLYCGRAISIAAPAGLVIWLFANIGINGESLLSIIANFLNPFAQLMGLDGYILAAFILGIPANEIVLPIILMIFTILHFPCTTTLLTIKKETGSWKWTIISFLIPTVCGIVLCMLTTFVYNILLI